MEKPGLYYVLPDGRKAYLWAQNYKPEVNHWYLNRDSENEFWKITKDFYSPEEKTTYYRIVSYYNGDILYTGRTLAQIRAIMRNNTYRMVIS